MPQRADCPTPSSPESLAFNVSHSAMKLTPRCCNGVDCVFRGIESRIGCLYMSPMDAEIILETEIYGPLRSGGGDPFRTLAGQSATLEVDGPERCKWGRRIGGVRLIVVAVTSC